MKLGISIKINVSKLDKSRFFRGNKGTYADLTAFIDLENVSQYGDNGTVTQSVSKEERQAGTKLPILGNVKIFYRDEAGTPVAREGYQPVDDSEDSVPF